MKKQHGCLIVVFVLQKRKRPSQQIFRCTIVEINNIWIPYTVSISDLPINSVNGGKLKNITCKNLRVHSFWVTKIRIVDPRSLATWCIKGTEESTCALSWSQIYWLLCYVMMQGILDY